MEPIRATHNNPVWRARADFLIAGTIPDAPVGSTEQIWARQHSSNQFEVCGIPFFLYDIALGDIVETDDNYSIERVVGVSGRYVFRVWFGETIHPRGQIANDLEQMGALLEWSSTNLLAVDASDQKAATAIAEYLERQVQHSHLIYETGRG